MSSEALTTYENGEAKNGAHALLKSHSRSLLRRQNKTKLNDLDWVVDLKTRSRVVVEFAAMDEKGTSSVVDPDHMFLSMVRQELIDDILFLYQEEEELFHTIISLGSDIAGHPRITHGGFSSAVMDEATGGLVYSLKHAGKLGEGPAFTARLEVNYRKPLPTNIVILCTAKVDSVSGRKIWTSAEMRNHNGEDSILYADAKALYVTVRPEAAAVM